MTRYNKPHKRCAGIGMIEILITLLVLGIGLLGMIAIQARTLKSNQSALERSQASILMYSMLDTMRANRDAAISGSYNMTKQCGTFSGDGLIGDDRSKWLAAIQAAMGNRTDANGNSSTCGEISCNTNTCTIKIYWDDSRGMNGSSTQVMQLTSNI